MNLKQLVLDRINQLGDKAPEYFGKTQGAINVWKKTGSIPLAAIQKVLDDQGVKEAESAETPAPATQTEAPPVPQRIPTLEEIAQVVHNQGILLQQILDHLNKVVAPHVRDNLDAPLLQLQKDFIEQGKVIEVIKQRLAGGITTSQSPQLIPTREIQAVDGSFAGATKPPAPGYRNPQNTGVAPTLQEQQAQDRAGQVVGGVLTHNMTPAGPAVPLPEPEGEGASFGAGWNDTKQQAQAKLAASQGK